MPDLLITAAAEAKVLAVLRYAADSDRIATVTGQRVEWVVPAGSVDCTLGLTRLAGVHRDLASSHAAQAR